MQLGRSPCLLAILAIAFACAASTRAVADVPTPPPPTMSLVVNNQSATLLGGPPTYDADNNVWQSSFTAPGGNWGIENGIASFSNNAFIFYTFDARNFSTEAVSFLLIFSIPFTGGPYDLLDSQHSSKLNDGNLDEGVPVNGIASVETGNDLAFVHNPQIDGINVPGAGISSGCLVSGSTGFVEKVCQDSLLATVPIAAQSHGSLSVALSFILSPRDTLQALGTVDLVPAVIPEPRTDLLLFAGVVMAIGVIARRRIR